MTKNNLFASVGQIESQILLVRGQRIMLDADLAALYEVETGALNRAVKRNSERFPADFMFQLTAEEFTDLRCQIGISNNSVGNAAGRGGRRHLPYAFTEHGTIMAASVLNSRRAVEASVQVVRAFVQLRQMLASNAELSRKLVAMEKNYDIKFKAIFEAIHQLMTPTDPKKKHSIGFAPWEKK
ncbi:MAG: ORF6N domain-containing protein [Gallionellaceae bacterium]|nr:ORF6N domain-containing protein [Gallionellaceae bacterium]